MCIRDSADTANLVNVAGGTITFVDNEIWNPPTSGSVDALNIASDNSANNVSGNNFNGWNFIAPGNAGTYGPNNIAHGGLSISNKLGIGTTSPSYSLDVAGFINTDQYSGFKQAGNTILYASSTLFVTFGGIGAGANVIANGTSTDSTSGPYATAFGYQALGNATSSGNLSTAVGYQALKSSAT